MRKKILIANWKMNKTNEQVDQFLDVVLPVIASLGTHDVIAGVAPVALHLERAVKRNRPTRLLTVAQDAHFEKSGAFTGCVSYTQLKDAGIDYVIIGHSERRSMFHETDETINKKILALVSDNMIPVFCVGETLAQYEAKQTKAVIDRQLTVGLANVPAERIDSIVIAYEPVWAIGTGKSATPAQAQEVIAFIRHRISQLFGDDCARQILIQYGGSVKVENVKEICSQPDIDGALIGSAALDPAAFAAMIKALA